MAKPAKTVRRSARAAQKLAKHTADRADVLQAAFDSAAGVTPAQFAQNVVGQGLDMLNAWLDLLRGVSDTPPSVFIEIVVTGGAGNVTRGATVTLDDPAPNLAALVATPLTSPTATIQVAGPQSFIVLSNPGPGPEVEDLRIDVTVPNGQTQTLYRGFVAIGAVVQVEVNVSVHL